MSLTSAVGVLKAAAEPTRLRLIALLAHGELNVKDLTRILGQSQPRISRHLKLLTETGLVERAPEGSWVYFRLAAEGQGREVAQHILDGLSKSDPALLRDRRRADAVKAERQEAAQGYFQAHAGDWDRIRALHAGDADVEQAVSTALGPGPFNLLVDLGTGTGRMLELFATRYRRGIGLDLSPAMLAYARANLERAGLSHVQVRQGDICDLPLADQSADAVVMHQVLHFLSDPQPAIREAARVLAPGGRLLVVDFAPHELEFLREEYAHQRLGFGRAQMRQWLEDCGLGVLESHQVPPPDNGGDQLAVSIWLAGRAPAGIATEANERNVERIG